ncbi:hypothetical protein CISIN_1g0437192mg, partial [Citrus sinensis]
QPSDDLSPPVLDTNGQALQRGLEYYILPEDNATGGGLTLVERNDSCPLYVGQKETSGSEGLFPVTFSPFVGEENIVRESHDFIVTFSAFTTCIQSTAWRVGESDPKTGRRFIVTGGVPGFFRIDRNGTSYNLGWCPSMACPNCRLRCGFAGILIENGKRLLALDGPALPFVFKRA